MVLTLCVLLSNHRSNQQRKLASGVLKDGTTSFIEVDGRVYAFTGDGEAGLKFRACT